MIKINEIIACHGAADIPSYTNTWSFGPSNQCEEFFCLFSKKLVDPELFLFSHGVCNVAQTRKQLTFTPRKFS